MPKNMIIRVTEGMMYSRILLCVLLLLVLTDCEDQITQTIDFSNHNLLYKMYDASNVDSYIEYFYDATYQLVKQEFYGSDGLEAVLEYEYDEHKRIIKETSFHTYYGVPEHSYLVYEYNAQNLPAKALAYLKVGDTYEFRSTTTYEYASNDRLLFDNIFNDDGVKTKYLALQYDSVGNVVETRFYQGGELSYHDRYEYDDQHNPLYRLTNKSTVQNLSPNNVITHSHRNVIMNGAEYTRQYRYYYNSNNYPTRCITGSTTIVYEYY